MAYQQGMPRYKKNDDGTYSATKAGTYYKAGDGKMYEMTKAELEGMDAPGKQPADQPHITSYPGTHPDYPGWNNPKGGAVGKSEITVDDFQKSLDQLEALASAGDGGASRKEELLQKSLAGEELSEEERDFLFKALGGGDAAVDDDPKITDDITKSLQPEGNESIQKALDVSDYLEQQHNGLIESLSTVGETIEKSEQRQHEFNMILAKALHQTGGLIKAMSHRLGVLEKQPARAPKSQGIPAQGQHLEKSFGGQAPEGEQLSKSEILDTLEEMMQKSVDSGKEGMAACGEDICKATAKYEQVNQLSPKLYGEVMKFRQENAH